MLATILGVVVVVALFVASFLCVIHKKKIKDWLHSKVLPHLRGHERLIEEETTSPTPVQQTAAVHGDYDAEFRMLSQRSPCKPCTIGRSQENLSKNRYPDVVPYDENRIILKHGRHGDYINASRISGIFIATQDPLPDQDEDFWSMLWSNNVSVIIRLSSESTEYPVAQYIPDLVNDTWVFGKDEMKVTKYSVHQMGEIRVAKLMVEKDLQIRDIVHYHMTCWSRGKTPPVKDALQLVTAAQNTHSGLTKKIVVHCGAGAGRTGTLIALWQFIEIIDAGLQPDVFKTVEKLREQRAGMVQTSVQYAFLYKCINAYKGYEHVYSRDNLI